MSLRSMTTGILAAGLVAAGAGAPAQAAPPERYVEPVDFVVTAHPMYTEACGFPVDLHVWGTFLVRTWHDDEGDPVRELRNFRFASETTANGKSVRGVSRGPEMAYFHEDGSTTVHIHGIVNRTVPGSGTVRLAWGHGITLWPADGSDDIVIEPTGGPEDLQPLCDYLAP